MKMLGWRRIATAITISVLVTACGGDNAALEERIAELENQLEATTTTVAPKTAPSSTTTETTAPEPEGPTRSVVCSDGSIVKAPKELPVVDVQRQYCPDVAGERAVEFCDKWEPDAEDVATGVHGQAGNSYSVNIDEFLNRIALECPSLAKPAIDEYNADRLAAGTSVSSIDFTEVIADAAESVGGDPTVITAQASIVVEVDDCSAEGATGTVSHSGTGPVDIWMDIFLFDDDVRVDSFLALVPALGPDSEAMWEELWFRDGTSDRCEVFVSSIFPA